MKHNFLFILLIALTSSCSSPRLATTTKMEDGLCKAKLHHPAIYNQRIDTFLIYTGNDIYQNGIELVIKQISPPTTEWQKRLADNNCLSENPDDCLVWCLIDMPGIMDTIVKVIDTTLIKDYEKLLKEVFYLDQPSKIDWVDVPCSEELTPDFILSLSQSLKNHGYLHNPTSKYSKDFQKALNSFQLDNNLFRGGITIQSTRMLLH